MLRVEEFCYENDEKTDVSGQTSASRQ